jgi:hypothetical protein
MRVRQREIRQLIVTPRQTSIAGNLSMFFAAVSHDADDSAKPAVCGNFALNKLG